MKTYKAFQSFQILLVIVLSISAGIVGFITGVIIVAILEAIICD